MDGPGEVASKIRVRSGAEATVVLPCVTHTACTRLPKSTPTLSDFHGTVHVVLGRNVHLYPWRSSTVPLATTVALATTIMIHSTLLNVQVLSILRKNFKLSLRVRSNLPGKISPLCADSSSCLDYFDSLHTCRVQTVHVRSSQSTSRGNCLVSVNTIH